MIRLLVLLIQAQATLQAERDAAMSQAKGATAAAQTLLDAGDKKGKNDDKDSESERSLSLRQTVLKSDCMALRKKQIADQMGLHSWLNLNMSPVPVPADGARRWREREKQRQAVRQSQAAVPAVKTVSK